jgi:hypothetical protein
MIRKYIIALDSAYLHDEYIKYATHLDEAIKIKQEWIDSFDPPIDIYKEQIRIAQIIEDDK